MSQTCQEQASVGPAPRLSTETMGRRILRRLLEWGFWMPLTRGRIGGHDNERLAFAFTMMNDDETVQCQISDAAMDELAEVKGTPSIARQAQFVTHRDTIEKIASELFDKAPIMKGYVVRIFSKHIQGARRIS